MKLLYLMYLAYKLLWWALLFVLVFIVLWVDIFVASITFFILAIGAMFLMYLDKEGI